MGVFVFTKSVRHNVISPTHISGYFILESPLWGRGGGGVN